MPCNVINLNKHTGITAQEFKDALEKGRTVDLSSTLGLTGGIFSAVFP